MTNFKTERLEGSNIFTEDQEPLECPHCGHLDMTFSLLNDSTCECPECDGVFGYNEENTKMTKITVSECSSCGSKREHYPSNQSSLYGLVWYSCWDCDNVKAVIVDNQPLQPKQILSTDFLPQSSDIAINDKHDAIDDRSTQLTASTRATILLSISAEEAESSFRTYDMEDYNTFLIHNSDHAVGYISWASKWVQAEDMELPAISQMYLLPEYRNQGLGGSIAEAWAELTTSEYGTSAYAVESPNHDMRGCLTSIGHLDDDGPYEVYSYTAG